MVRPYLIFQILPVKGQEYHASWRKFEILFEEDIYLISWNFLQEAPNGAKTKNNFIVARRRDS
jgi:hypothetical protein